MAAIYKTPTTMPKEDYLLKYLEKLSRVIAAMLRLRSDISATLPTTATSLVQKRIIAGCRIRLT
jgi:hypothetical protein